MNSSSSNQNQYYLLLKGQEPVLWDIYDTTPRPEPDLFWTHSNYCAKLLQSVEKKLAIRDLIFYITFDQIRELPSYGKNIVVIMTGDEGCTIPMYAHKVLAIFKPYGSRPFLGYNPLVKPSYINFLNLIQFFKNWIYYLPGLQNYWINYLKKILLNDRNIENNLYAFPLGYYKQIELPIKEFKLRCNDIFFAGSVVNDTYSRKSLKYWITKWIKPPKILSRQQMLTNINNLKSKRSDFKFKLLVTAGFFSASNLDAKQYSEQIMNSKVCLVPRGTSFETYRFFEAMRCGCIIITESLPSRWFYDNSPAIQIEHWKYVGHILEELLDDEELMQRKHQETLMWWRNKCSSDATGQYIVDKLHALTNAAI
jgi:hypothetical protein